jgi:hypothetical protein
MVTGYNRNVVKQSTSVTVDDYKDIVCFDYFEAAKDQRKAINPYNFSHAWLHNRLVKHLMSGYALQ